MLRYGDWRTRVGALRCRFFGTPDRARWTDASAFDDWEERTRLIAGLIPAGSRVAELGAGSRMLEKYLDPSCTYLPCDLVSRGPDSLAFDLNRRPLPELGVVDVVVLAGVLEYIRSVPSLFEWLGGQAKQVIASYGCAKSRPGSPQRVVESYRRAGAGWVNSYSEAELMEMAARAGLSHERTLSWHEPDVEHIFVFRRSASDRE